jgi:hypothetical protein
MRSGTVFGLLSFLLVCMGTQENAWADIPPPPPEIPGTEIQLPNPVAIAMGGLLLSAAAVMVGLSLVRAKGYGSRKIIWSFGGLFLIGTVALTAWSLISYKAYEQTRSDWRPLGPVEQYDLEEIGDSEGSSAPEEGQAS